MRLVLSIFIVSISLISFGKSALASMSIDDARMVMSAARNGDFQSLKYMMAQGKDINYRDSEGNTLYCLAVKNNDTRTADVLKSFGGTSKGCPGVDPNYKPPRKTVYQEKTGIFAGSDAGEYLLLGGAIAGVAYFLGGQDTTSPSHDAPASGIDPIDPHVTNYTITVVPEAPDNISSSDPFINPDYEDTGISDSEFEFTFVSHEDTSVAGIGYSPWEQIGLQEAFAYGYTGEIILRNPSDDSVTGYSGSSVKVAIVDTAGVDVFHENFDAEDATENGYGDGLIYDYGNLDPYDGSDPDNLLQGDQGVASPFISGTGGSNLYLDYVDSFATQAAGIIGASRDDEGLVGIAPNANILSYSMGNDPFQAMTSAMNRGSGVIMYSAVRDLFSVEEDAFGDPFPVFDAYYTAGYLASAADKQDYFLTHLSQGYGAGAGDDANDLYGALGFGALAENMRPIFVISTGNDGFYAETNIEAAAPMAYPDLLGNFIAVTGVDSEGDLYSLQYDIPGTSAVTGTFGSNGCGMTAMWCLSAPADELITMAGGTSNMLNWFTFANDTTTVNDFVGYTNDPFDGMNGIDGPCSIPDSCETNPTVISTVDMGDYIETIIQYDEGGTITNTNHYDTVIHDYTSVYLNGNVWTPADGGTYFQFLDLNDNDTFDAGDYDIHTADSAMITTKLGGVDNTTTFLARWVEAGVGDSTGKWQIYNGATWEDHTTENIVAYFIDKDGDGELSVGDFLSDDGTASGTGMSWNIVNSYWNLPGDLTWQEVFFLNDDGSGATGGEALNDAGLTSIYAPLDIVVRDINGDGMIVGRSMSFDDYNAGKDDSWTDWAYIDYAGAEEWSSDFGSFEWGQDGDGNDLEFYDFYFVDMDNDGIYSPGDLLYMPMIGSAAATAVVAGGVALIKSAFAHMSNEQIVALLFATATDLGATGVDTTYGHGMINLGKAMQPYGEVRVPIDWTTASWANAYTDPSAPPSMSPTTPGGVPLAATGMRMGQAFGDAGLVMNDISFVGLDVFDRGYNYSMGMFVQSSVSLPSLYELSQTFGSIQEQNIQVTDNLSFSLSTRAVSDSAMTSEIPVNVKFTLTRDNTELSASLGDSGFSFYEEEGGSIGGVIRRDVVYNPYMALIDDQSVGMKYKVKLSDTWSLSSLSSYGQNRFEDGRETESYSLMSQVEQEQYLGHVAVSMTRLMKTFGEGAFSVGLDTGMAYEEKTVLGALNQGAFQVQNGTMTNFYSLNFSGRPLEKMQIFGGYTQGRSKVQSHEVSFFQNIRDIETSSFHVGANYEISKAQSFGLIVAQPLRVNSAQAEMAVPVARDPVENIIYMENRSVNLSPTSYELDVQAFMSLKGENGVVDIGVLHQFNPGHSDYFKDDTTFMMKFKTTLN
ncbi:MAG: S8 family serine peptidase [Alphaproteobacteria bacterium]|nr:S8 family serine peptidase [Alphaproteobacteria bacterium]